MTLKEIQGFLLAVGYNETIDRIGQTITIATGAQSDGKAIKKSVDDLKKDLARINKQMETLLK